MTKIVGFACGVFALLLVVWLGLIETKGNHLAPNGWISNIRGQALSDEITLLVVDFGVLNDSDQQMVVSAIDPWITTQGGNNIHGSLYAGSDVAKALKFYPKLGPQMNEPLLLRGTIDPRKTVNRMVGIEFDVPAKVIENRRSFTLKLTDITGPEVEMTQ